MKVPVDNTMLRELAHKAKDNGRLDEFISLALAWADAATAEVERLNEEIEMLNN